MSSVAGMVAGLVAGLAAGLLGGFSAVLVDLEPEVLALSSSEKLFFNHLDGKHMAEKKGREGGGGGWCSKVS